MKGITWSRDSHGLFDYESRHLTKRTLKADKSNMIMRIGNELSLVQYNADGSFVDQIGVNSTGPDDKALLKIINQNNSTFYLESATYLHNQKDLETMQAAESKPQEQMFLVVRSLKHNNEKIVSALIVIYRVWLQDYEI